MPVQYEDKEVKLEMFENPDGSIDEKAITGWTNRLTQDFKDNGFVVLRDFIPKEIINMVMDSWKTIEHNQEWNDTFFIREDDIIHDSPESSLRKSQGCHTFPPGVSMHRWLRDALMKVIDFQLVETYTYSRKYDRGAFLKAHSDRPSCEVSATICLGYKSDDNTPWKIWVQRDKNYIDVARGNGQQLFYDECQNIPHRDRKGVPISLEVGDVLLYQGPNAVHWRDTFLGDYSYHMFCHFINNTGRINDFEKFNNGNFNIEGHVSAESRPYNVFNYDGRKSRYHPNSEQSDGFLDAMEFWNQWSEGHHNWFEPSDWINNYREKEVELTDREKERKDKNDGI